MVEILSRKLSLAYKYNITGLSLGEDKDEGRGLITWGQVDRMTKNRVEYIMLVF